MRLVFLCVAAIALALLLMRAARLGMAGDYIDPVGKIGGQDEALYSHSAIQMAQHGAWLTPTFMGRYGLYKPPLLPALAGFSARIFGISRLGLRFPIALIACLAVGLVWWWGAEFRSPIAGFCAAALLVSNHLWHSLSSMVMTDGILAACYVAALFCIFVDPWLESAGTVWGFALAAAGAILVKSVAGLFPLMALGLYWIAAPRNQRPRMSRVLLAGALTAALAAPWFLYQLAAHNRWFWAEFVGVEILGYGAGTPPQTSQESHLAFYASRMLLLDPVLLALCLGSVIPLLKDLRKRTGPATLLAIGFGVPVVVSLLWGYRNISYVLPAMPIAALIAGTYNSLCDGRPARFTLAFLGLAFVAKAAMPSMPWTVSFEAGTKAAESAVLTNYCERGRGNQLILVDMQDEFFASILPLPKIRYVLQGATPPAGKYGLDYAGMGIILNAPQFNDLPAWTPVFRERLKSWGLDSTEPIGSVVLISNDTELASIVSAHPESDFIMPERYRAAVTAAASAAHDGVSVTPGRLLLLSRKAIAAAPHAWSCRM